MPTTKKIKIRRKDKTIADDRRYMTQKKRERIDRNRQRQAQALELRQGGATFEQIATAMGLSQKGAAKQLVERALEKFEIEAARNVVRLDLARLDEFIMRCTHDLRQNGNLSQIDRLMRIMEFRYRLLRINGEDVDVLRQEHGVTNVHIKGGVQIVQASPETEEEFIKKMMGAVGVDPNSPTAQKYLQERDANVRALPMLKGSANETRIIDTDTELLEDDFDEAVEAEIVEED